MNFNDFKQIGCRIIYNFINILFGTFIYLLTLKILFENQYVKYYEVGLLSVTYLYYLTGTFDRDFYIIISNENIQISLMLCLFFWSITVARFYYDIKN